MEGRAGSPFPARLASLRRACEGTDVGTDGDADGRAGVLGIYSALRGGEADSLMSRLETVCRRAGLLLVPLYEIKKLKSANA